MGQKLLFGPETLPCADHNDTKDPFRVSNDKYYVLRPKIDNQFQRRASLSIQIQYHWRLLTLTPINVSGQLDGPKHFSTIHCQLS